MMDTEDGRELEMNMEGTMEVGGAVLFRSVPNDGGRSEPFHSWENLMMQIRPDAQSDARRERLHKSRGCFLKAAI